MHSTYNYFPPEDLYFPEAHHSLASGNSHLTAVMSPFGKILAAAVQRGQAIILTGDKPAVFIKDGLHSKFVMLKEQVLFGGSVVGVLRA